MLLLLFCNTGIPSKQGNKSRKQQGIDMASPPPNQDYFISVIVTTKLRTLVHKNKT